MFTIDDESYEIHLSRGDTATIDFQFEGDVPTSSAGDQVIMTLKKSPSEKYSKWSKKATLWGEDLCRINLTSDDTKSLSFGKYYYDLRAFFRNGSVTSILPPTPFYVEEVIGDDR